MIMNGYKYKYNGKELQTDLDINLYDYGARNYDPAIGRWFNIDYYSEKYYPVSPYIYAINNPVNVIDPDGRDVIVTNEDDQSLFLSYIQDQLGENHGFSFNKNGKLNHKSSKEQRENKKGYNKEQKDIFSGLKEVSEDSNRHIDVAFTKSTGDVEIDIQVFEVTVKDGQFIDTNNLTTLATEKVNITDRGGAFFYIPSALDKTNTAKLRMNSSRTDSSVFDDDSGGKTGNCSSCAMIHEILDHGLEYIRTVSNTNSSKNTKNAVNYHNKALNNKGKKSRSSHYGD